MSQQDRTQLLTLNKLVKAIVQNTLHNNKTLAAKEKAAAKELIITLLGRSPTEEDLTIALTV